MNQIIKNIIKQLKHNTISESDAVCALKSLFYKDIGCAKVDHLRKERKGFPEVVYGENKSSEQIYKIVTELLKYNDVFLVTRANKKQYNFLKKKIKNIKFNELGRCIYLDKRKNIKLIGKIAIITAGTSDIPIAEEAFVTANLMGSNVVKIYDAGVAGIHRLFDNFDEFNSANVIIVIAGMEGALPSVVGGMVSKPVIAVPTSVGYGTSMSGLTPLFAMLNSCASGVTVVNIDNGFGAGYSAHLINQMAG